MAVLPVLALLGLAVAYEKFGHWAAVTVILAITVFCSLWRFHLKARSLPDTWNWVIAGLLAFQLVMPFVRQPAMPAAVYLSALGCGVFVYATLWVLALHEGEPGLRPFATFAILLSLGVLAKPAVAFSCILLSLVLFLRSCRSFNSALTSALLLFTPAALCIAAVVALDFLAVGSMRVALPPIVSLHHHHPPLAGPHGWHGFESGLSAVCFSGSVLMSRVLERKTGIVDGSYGLLIVFLGTAGMAQWMPEALSMIDVCTIIYAGACCMLALDPPHRLWVRLLVCFGSYSAFLLHLAR